MKKTITILLIITIILTLLPIYVYAEDNSTEGNSTLTYKKSSFDSLMNEGGAKVGNKTTTLVEAFSLGTTVMITTVLATALIPFTINCLLTLVTMPQNVIEEGEKWELQAFTIGNTVIGEIDLFDINFFDDSKFLNEDPTKISIFNATGRGEVNQIIKETVAKWYVAIRDLAIILNLLVLVYMGIRMALSSIASEKAKYKGMLIDWAVSLVLIFVLQYIILILMTGAKIIMNIVIPKNTDIIQETEGTIMRDLLTNMVTGTNWNMLLALITYIVYTVYNVKFFLLYSKRLVSTAFLVIIAPLITVTYAIDRVGDKKAQALGVWFSEILVNIFIQPLHAILYLIFIYSAANIIKQAPILGIALFMTLSRGEKVVKEMFKMRGKTSINSMSAYMPVKKGE